jgi:hypothetical protein
MEESKKKFDTLNTGGQTFFILFKEIIWEKR